MHDPRAATRKEPESESVHEPPGRPWELELLISGAVVFALLQVPSEVGRLYARLDPMVAGTMRLISFGAYYFVTIVLYALVSSFVVHLAARAYWVGLVGLDAVFPQGVRWDQLRYGPITEDVYRRRQPSLESLIARTDRFCSVIFSFSFSLVFVLLIGTFIAAAGGVLAWVLSRVFFGGEHLETLFFTLLGALAALQVATTVVDRKMGERLAGRPGAGRLVRRYTEWLYSAQLMMLYQPVFNILYSNLGKRRLNILTQLVTICLIGAFLVTNLAQRGRLTADSYSYLPAAGEAGSVDYRHYESQRGPDETLPDEPSIQSDVVREPFVRLFLPYNPPRHNAVIPERCPEVERLQESGPRIVPRVPAAATDEVLRCLAGLQRITLNGQVVRDLPFRFYEHPRTHLRGMVGYIPTAGLPPGENLLIVDPLPRPAGSEREDRPDMPHFIPFWIAR